MFGWRKFQDIVIMSPWRGLEMNVISKIYWNSVEKKWGNYAIMPLPGGWELRVESSGWQTSRPCD